jgi:hypothetical protein
MNHKQKALHLGLMFAAISLTAIGCEKGHVTSPTPQASSQNAERGPAGKQLPEEDVLGKYQFAHKVGGVNRPLTAKVPRNLVYNGLRVTVTKGTISDAPPPAKMQRPGADHVYAYLDVSISNQRESTTFSGISPGLFKLQLGEDAFGSPLSENWLLELKPRATEKVTLVFAVPKETTWDRAALVISQAQEEPETLSLHGPVPPLRTPTAFVLPARKEIQSGDFVCKLTAVTSDVEHEQKRVPKGQRYLTIAGALVYQGMLMSANFAGDRQFRLLVGQEPAEAVSYPITNLIPKTSKAFDAVYLIPVGTKAVEFRLGDKDDVAAKVLLELKAAQP